MAEAQDIAVLGGGFAGSYCAHLLGKAGKNVTLFDMGRGVGGRSSTRYASGFQFDHGCSFIVPRSQTIKDLLHTIKDAGAAEPWNCRLAHIKFGTDPQILTDNASLSKVPVEGNFCGVFNEGSEAWVGKPGMRSIPGYLADGENIHLRTKCKVTNAKNLGGNRWQITAKQGSDDGESTVKQDFDLLVISDPTVTLKDVPGAVDFGDKASLDVLQRVNHTGKVPIFSLMIVLKSPAPGQTIDAATVTGSDFIQWLSRDTSKPGRERDDNQECWVAVSTRAFGEKLQSRGVQNPDESVEELQEEFLKLLKVLAKGEELPMVTSAHAMKWGCAFRKEVVKDRSLLDTENGIGACGDYCVESLAEGALLSAHHLADQILSAK